MHTKIVKMMMESVLNIYILMHSWKFFLAFLYLIELIGFLFINKN